MGESYAAYSKRYTMPKSFILIFAVLLSSVFGGERSSDAGERSCRFTDAVVRCSEQDTTDEKSGLNDFAILPARTVSCSGDGNDFAPSFRSVNSLRRLQPSFKSAFCVIKDGKLIDRNNFYTFRTVLLRFQSGIRSNSRYIHSICQLLI